MTVSLSVEAKAPYWISLPSGIYPQLGLALVDLAVALTKDKLLMDAQGRKDTCGMRASLKAARELVNYEQTGDGYLFEDGNLRIELTLNEGFRARATQQVFCDSDGVIANFDLHVQTITGKTIAELGDERMWELVGNDTRFWDDMPILPDAERLWAAIAPLKPIVLTGCPKTAYDLSMARKRAWWKRHFDQDEVITCLSRDKALFVSVPGDVLIDDFYVNIKRWRAAGGTGIWHKNVDDTLEQLSKIGLI